MHDYAENPDVLKPISPGLLLKVKIVARGVEDISPFYVFRWLSVEKQVFNTTDNPYGNPGMTAVPVIKLFSHGARFHWVPDEFQQDRRFGDE